MINIDPQRWAAYRYDQRTVDEHRSHGEAIASGGAYGGIDGQTGHTTGRALLRDRADGAADTGDSAHVAACSRSEELTSELQSLMRISYAVFCLKIKKDSPSFQPPRPRLLTPSDFLDSLIPTTPLSPLCLYDII